MTNRQYTIHKGFSVILFIVYCLLFASAPTALAQDGTEYKMLAPLPYVGIEYSADGREATTTASSYIAGFTKLLIGLAGVAAVVMLVYGGILYMSTDAIYKKGEGRKMIENSLWGFGFILASFMILYTINPRLLEFDITLSKTQEGSPFATESEPPPGGDIVPSGEFGCVDCVRIINPDGTPVFGFPNKTPSQNGCKGSPFEYSCIINHDLATKLETLANDLEARRYKGNDISWRVTELFPPSSDTLHVSTCHNKNTSRSGMCVDASLTRDGQTLASFPDEINAQNQQYKSCINPRILNLYLQAIQRNFRNNFQYEVPSSPDNPQSVCLSYYKNSANIDSNLRAKIESNAVNGEHAHINL